MLGRVSSVGERLRAGRLRGTFVKLRALEVIEILAARLDFAVVDLEHSQLSEGDALRLVRHAAVLEFPAIVRIPELDRGAVNRLLEAGAAGIQLSTVRRASEVVGLREATRYAPEGNRSISLSHPGAGYGDVALDEYLRGSQPPLLVVQVETLETLDALAEILRAGADVAFVGVTDITVDAALDAERARARVDEIVEAALAAGVVPGGFGDDPRFRYSVVSSDVALLQQAVAVA